MISLSATKRDVLGKKVRVLRAKDLIPGVLYGPGSDPSALSVAKKEFDRAYQEAGESSLVSLQVGKATTPVLIRSVQRHPLSGKFIHVDFYQPRLDEKIKIQVPLHVEGEAPAVKDFEGTLIQNMHEIEVSALPQDLPSEIMVDVSVLKNIEDRILVGDLQIDPKVEVMAEKEWIVAQVVPAENVEEELSKPVEEEAAAVAAVEKVEEKKEGEEETAQEGEEQNS